jgi:hypothetical protein
MIGTYLLMMAASPGDVEWIFRANVKSGSRCPDPTDDDPHPAANRHPPAQAAQRRSGG